MTAERIRTFDEFWPFYLGQHSVPACRALHFLGTNAALGTIATAALTRTPVIAALALVAGYGPAWVAHFFIEKNRPATFTYPLWSLIADFKMWSLMLRGRLWTGTPGTNAREA